MFLPLVCMKWRGTPQIPHVEYASPPHTLHAFGYLRAVSTDLICFSSPDKFPQRREFSPLPFFALLNSFSSNSFCFAEALGRPLFRLPLLPSPCSSVAVEEAVGEPRS